MAQKIKRRLGKREDRCSDPHSSQKSGAGALAACKLSTKKAERRSLWQTDYLDFSESQFSVWQESLH